MRGSDMKMAVYVRELRSPGPQPGGAQHGQYLWRVSPPMPAPLYGSFDHVVTSAITRAEYEECLVFGASADGDILCWGGLSGVRETVSHEAALTAEGYAVVWPEHGRGAHA